MGSSALRTQHTVRFQPAVRDQLKTRAALIGRPINSETCHLIAAFFAENPPAISTSEYLQRLDQIGCSRQAQSSEPISLRMPRRLAEIVHERAQAAGVGFNHEVKRILVWMLAEKRRMNDEVVNSFKEHLQRASQLLPETAETAHCA